MYRIVLSLLVCIFSCNNCLIAQVPCSTLGQAPPTAFPVCGTDTFSQSTVPLCGGYTLPVPPCSGDGYVYNDINPFWYKFTCFKSGTLGFSITPNDITDDYDWQIFDITGHNPTDVYTNASLFFACDWSGNTGVTGTGLSNTNNGCGGVGYPTITAMPNLVVGHNYLLMISHFTQSQTGYKLSFGGGTASITDTTPPKLATANASCDGTQIRVKLNKTMKCSSVASNGSDFSLTANIIVAATGVNCNNGFDMDSIVLTMANPIPLGNYTLYMQTGNDGNTILDNCNNGIPVGDSLPIIVTPQFPTPMDSLVSNNCAVSQVVLVFKKNIQCSSIAPDGSDFVITGTNPVTVASAAGNCGTSGLTRTITVTFAQPINLAGNYTITLQTGSDGNTLINECAKETPAGESLPFTTYDTVSAAFSFKLQYGCVTDSITFSNPVNNNKNSWAWQLSSGVADTLPSFSTKVPVSFLLDTVQLMVSNGFCSDVDTQVLPLVYDTLKAIFIAPEFYCPNDLYTVKDSSIGKIETYLWVYSDGQSNGLATPPSRTFTPPVTEEEKDDTLKLIVTDSVGCTDTTSKIIRVMRSCYIAVPTGFTPNADGVNDYLYPLSGFKANNFSFTVYNRWGQTVFTSHDYYQRWDGTFKGIPQPTGTYIWTLTYNDPITGKQVSQRGTSVLIR